MPTGQGIYDDADEPDEGQTGSPESIHADADVDDATPDVITADDDGDEPTD